MFYYSVQNVLCLASSELRSIAILPPCVLAYTQLLRCFTAVVFCALKCGCKEKAPQLSFPSHRGFLGVWLHGEREGYSLPAPKLVLLSIRISPGFEHCTLLIKGTDCRCACLHSYMLGHSSFPCLLIISIPSNLLSLILLLSVLYRFPSL